MSAKKKVYKIHEPLSCDYRKLGMVNNEGKNIAFPKLMKRKVLKDNEGLGKRVSLLDEELNKGNDDRKGEERSDDDDEENADIFEDLKLPEQFFNGKKRKRSGDNNCNENDDKEDKVEKNSVVDINDLKMLDENSDEYQLALRKKIGLN